MINSHLCYMVCLLTDTSLLHMSIFIPASNHVHAVMMQYHVTVWFSVDLSVLIH